VGVSAQGLQKPNTARGNGSRALKYGLFQPQGEPFMGWYVLAAFNKQYSEPGGGRRTMGTHFIAALGQRPPRAGGQNVVWLRPL